MPNYESVFIARQDISASQVEALADGFAKFIEDQGGSITRREHWGLRNLAYRIKKNRKGHYVLFNMDAPSSAVHEMERQMRINEDILRYLTLRVEEPEDGPSAMLQSRSGPERGRGDRGDRGRRDDGPRDRGDHGDRPRQDEGDKGTPNGAAASSEGGTNGMDASPLMFIGRRVELDPRGPRASKCQKGRASSSQANRRVRDED